MDAVDVRVLARALLDVHGLTDWQVVIDRAKTRAGICRYESRTIGISGPLAAVHPDDVVRDTILHEIAHALVGPEHGHDRIWQQAARQIGGTGTRRVPLESGRVPGRWEGRCPAGHVVTRHRQPRRVVTCASCSRRFDLRHLLTWTRDGNPVQLTGPYAAELARLRRRA